MISAEEKSSHQKEDALAWNVLCLSNDSCVGHFGFKCWCLTCRFPFSRLSPDAGTPPLWVWTYLTFLCLFLGRSTKTGVSRSRTLDLLGPCAPDRQNINHGRLAIPRPCWSDTQPCSFFASPCPPTVSPLGNGQMRDLVYIGPEYYIFSLPTAAKVSWLGRTSGMTFNVS